MGFDRNIPYAAQRQVKTQSDVRGFITPGVAVQAGLFLTVMLAIIMFGTKVTADQSLSRRYHVQIAMPSLSARGFPARIVVPARRPPYPLALIIHGLTTNAADRARVRMPKYARLEEFLLKRGFAVVIHRRPGYGPGGGPFLEDYGDCERPDYAKSANTIAQIIALTLKAVRQRIKTRRRILLIGHSGGAMGALAFAAKNSKTVRATLNFSGGFGGRSFGQPDHNCSPGQLIGLARKLGVQNKVSSLWLYARNDSYFVPRLSRAMANAYRAAGGILEFHLLPPVTRVGHGIIVSNRAAKIWSPIVDRFMASHK